MGIRVTCYDDECIHQINSHCGKKDGNITIGNTAKRKGNKKRSACWDYEEKK